MALLYVLLAVLFIGPFILMLWGYFNGRSQDLNESSSRPIPVRLIANSAVLYALSYNVIYFIQELFLCLGKQRIGLTSYLYHNNHNWEGSDPRDQLMQGTGALAIFVLGVILLYVFLHIRSNRSWWTLFILWLTFHALIQSLPQVATAPLDPGSDTGQAFVYLNMPAAVNITLAALGILAIVWLSYLFSKYFLALGREGQTFDHPFKRFKTVWQVAVLPAILGTILLFPYRIPPVDRYTMTYMLLLVSIPSVFAFAWVGKAPKAVGSGAYDKVLVIPIVLSILVLLFFHIVLRPGVVFYG